MREELSVDKFNKNDGRIYEVIEIVRNGDGTVAVSNNTQGLLAQPVAKELPEVDRQLKIGLIMIKSFNPKNHSSDKC